MIKLFFCSLLTVLFLTACVSEESDIRKKIKIDNDWKFHFGNVTDAQNFDYNDSGWRVLNLPHDWMVEMPPNSVAPAGTAGGFVTGGIGWYRKQLEIPEDFSNKKLYLQFDGIYENSTVWINGEKLGHRDYGYITHLYDASELIKPGESNVVAVKVDATRQPADRWFSGAGIYRHVWLHVIDSLHIPVWGTNVTTPEISRENARINLGIELKNDYKSDQSFELITKILNENGTVVAEKLSQGVVVAESLLKTDQKLDIKNPELWSTDNPAMYEAVSVVNLNGQTVDEYSTPFGIRDIQFTPEKGFMLNGEKIMLKGVNVHHDAGPLGAAVPLAVWERRFQVLKDLGVNSIRFSHNPHMPELLDLCDRMGLLVYNEMYDKWAIPWQNMDDSAYVAARKKIFHDTWRHDLTDFIDRDKNHPSVIIWSIGNETREQLHDPEAGAEIVEDLMELVHEIDPTRKVTAAMHPRNKNSEFPSRLMYLLDVVSYNYETHNFEEWRKENPGLIFIASETKLYNNPFHTISFDTVNYSKNSWFEMEEWMAGQYIWAGIDYLGESFAWPDKGFRGGVLYTNGFEKASTGFTEGIYSNKPMVQLAVLSDSMASFYNAQDTWQKSWWPPALVDHWNFSEGEIMDVYGFTNASSVELLLNGKSIGTKNKQDYQDGVLRWQVPFVPGRLEALARNGVETVAEDQLTTAGTVSKLKMYPDKTTITADNDDVVHIVVHLEDKDGNRHALANEQVSLSISGPGKIIGVDNGNLAEHYDWKGDKVNPMDGRCLVYVQANGKSGNITVTASARGLESDNVNIVIRE